MLYQTGVAPVFLSLLTEESRQRDHGLAPSRVIAHIRPDQAIVAMSGNKINKRYYRMVRACDSLVGRSLLCFAYEDLLPLVAAKGNEMKIDLKCKLAMLPVLVCSASAVIAEPVSLDAHDMDRITAGAQPVLERLANAIEAVQKIRMDLGISALPAAMDDQQWIAALLMSDAPVTFQRTASGELVATQPLQSGGQLMIVKQPNPANAAAAPQSNPGDSVTTRLLQPGETLKIQQTGGNGANYLVVQGSGNSTVTVSQQHL